MKKGKTSNGYAGPHLTASARPAEIWADRPAPSIGLRKLPPMHYSLILYRLVTILIFCNSHFFFSDLFHTHLHFLLELLVYIYAMHWTKSRR